MVASLVGLPLEVDKLNLRRWDFVRVKIGCRDVKKVPAMVEGLLDFHFYEFTFQREVPIEGVTNAAGTKWTRNSDRQEEDSPSPKKPKRGENQAQDQTSGQHQGETTRENKSDSIANKEESERSKGKQVTTEEAPDNT